MEVEGLEAREVDVSSVSGDVRLEQVQSHRASMESVSGDLVYDGTLASGGRYEFKSHSGDIRLIIPGDVGFELEAQTFSGEVSSDFEMTVTSSDRRRRNLRGVVGDGSAVIEVTTFSGNVSIKRR